MRDWFHRLWHGVKKEATDLWRGVFQAIDAVVSYAHNIWNELANNLTHLFHWAANVAHWTVNFANAVWHGLTRVWSYLWHRLVPWALNELRRIGHDLVHGLQLAYDWAHNTLINLWGHVIHIAQWIERNLIAPLARTLRGFVVWVGHTFWRLVWDGIHALGHVFAILRRDVDNLVGKIGHWFDRAFWDTWHALTHYLGVLLAFLASPFEWLAKHLEVLIAHGAHWFAGQIVAALAANGSMIEDFLVRWLGE